MNNGNILMLVSALMLSMPNIALTEETMPWGQAAISHPEYKKQKVVYDLTADTIESLSNIFSRAGFLSKLNGDDPFDTKIVIVIHGDAIPFFSISSTKKYRKLMELAYSQTLNETVEFRMCQASARLRGFAASDIHGFVTMVPMADAEIVRLQKAGYAYMR
ncbi:MAG: DsrE family protein [Granulosicoccaceae bacterium]|jgi:intracellular sulfur oxidation DsrE/DsrF family protein